MWGDVVITEESSDSSIASYASDSASYPLSQTYDTASSDTAYAAEGIDASASAGEYPNDVFIDVPEEYASCGITSDPETAGWKYQGKWITVLYDRGNAEIIRVYRTCN